MSLCKTLLLWRYWTANADSRIHFFFNSRDTWFDVFFRYWWSDPLGAYSITMISTWPDWQNPNNLTMLGWSSLLMIFTSSSLTSKTVLAAASLYPLKGFLKVTRCTNPKPPSPTFSWMVKFLESSGESCSCLLADAPILCDAWHTWRFKRSWFSQMFLISHTIQTFFFWIIRFGESYICKTMF